MPPKERRVATGSHIEIFLGHDEQKYEITPFASVLLINKRLVEYTRHVRFFRRSIFYPEYIDLKLGGGNLGNIALENDNHSDIYVEDHNRINSR